jgi:predicted phage baseplate assembly protein
MRVPLPIPNLDDRSYDQLVKEAIRRIPVYAPDWTDHNVHDPGITLIELFAWLTEMQLYSLNRIGDRHYLKYLKLLGIQPRPARPARVDVTFSSESIVTVEKQSRVIAGDTTTGITFEIDEEIDVLPVELERVVCFSNLKYSEVTEFNEPSNTFYYALGEKAEVGAALYLGFKFDKATIGGREVKFNIYLYEEDLPPVGKHGNEMAKVYPSAEVLWEYWAGDIKEWSALELSPSVDEVVQTLSSSGRISFIMPSDIEESRISPVDEDLFWIRCRVMKAGYEIPPRIDRIILNTVAAVEGITVENEELGSSTGLPHQKFKTEKSPVLVGTQLITIMGEDWQQVDDFDASEPEDNHYVVDRETGEIVFSDGIRGKIPPQGEKIYITYRYGGGEKGNIPANSTTVVCNKTGNPLGIGVHNYFSAAGGSEKETIQEAILRAKLDLKTPFRAVSAEDFEYIARVTPGLRVARAKAKVTSDNAVTLVVVPYSPLETAVPSSGFMKTVCEHIDRHRLITTYIEIDKPEYVRVSVNTSVKIIEGANPDIVRGRIEKTIDGFLSPLKGGPDGDGWPFGRSVYRSEVYAVIDEVEGVDCVSKLSISGAAGDLDIDDLDLVYPGRHNIEIVEPGTVCEETGYE